MRIARSLLGKQANLRCLLPTMAPENISKVLTPYEKSITRLNGLQNNATTIRKSLRQKTPNVNHEITKWCLDKCNIELDEIDKLNIIHVGGTKGKGSTCAFVESILRQFGFKTGLYSSPHLIHVRERIRINGDPLLEEDFVRYFEHIYGSLEKAVKESDKSMVMPPYFKFLTVMAFHVFIEEKVDVAIVEVGIGGEHDCTNIIRNPALCGITTLDYDHTSMLGLTIESIAWHKAGIFKNGSIAVVTEQPDKAMEVFKKRATSKNCHLHIAPPFNAYGWPLDNIEYGIPGTHQQLNITLAFQLVKLWLEKVRELTHLFGHAEKVQLSGRELLPGFNVPQKFLDGIRLCKWPGRCQIIRRGSVTYYLDGAHTPKSLEKHDFKLALFCPPRLDPASEQHSYQDSYTCLSYDELIRVAKHAAIWRNLSSDGKIAEEFDCVQKAIEKIGKLGAKNEVAVLVTGSLHLVGCVLAALGFQI